MTRVVLCLLAFTFLACGNSHEAPGGPAVLGSEPGPWCGEDGTWRLTIDLGVIAPFEYEVSVENSVFFGIDDSCAFRWASDTDACSYAFEIVCESPDIRRT